MIVPHAARGCPNLILPHETLGGLFSFSIASSRAIWLEVSFSLHALSFILNTHVSLLACLHLASLASSFTLKPNIRGSYRSAFNAALAPPPPPAPLPIPPSLAAGGRLSSLSVIPPLPGGGCPLVGTNCGYTMSSMCGNVVPKYAPSIVPCRLDLGE